ncbi:bifunctional hydroxymethylpyrimidine kinase/phosphomethylpyrimidine kinase [Natronoarchaeum sp. GCM10025703]|uniref:bifunctional hydroxymethylpyrimidine kinase/phosphomethylpyrimidine kinase n=1 Tax=unclassified Natronoarchaeum TaxID=2620183 RepID=UPI003610C0D1
MKPAAAERRPVTLTIAGSDSGGGAGIQADLKTMEATGAFATSAITAVTSQNTVGVDRSHVLPTAEIEAQCDAVFDDFEVQAIKTGMLATAPVISLVTDRVAAHDAPAVVDPVMVATTGDRLLDAEAEDAYEALIAESTLVTPNADEAEVLTGAALETTADARAAGEELVAMGAAAALVKGGHLHEDEGTVIDVLVTEETVEEFEHPRVETAATHGSGCTLSSAIAARLARADSLVDAVEWATDFMHSAVRYHHDVGQGPGAVHHLVDLRNRTDRHPTVKRLDALVEQIRSASTAVEGRHIDLAVGTAYAETLEDVATTTVGSDGGAIDHQPDRRFGADEAVAQRLLGVRDAKPSVRFAASMALPEETARPETVDLTYRATADTRAACRRSAEATAESPILLEEQSGDMTVYTALGSDTAAVSKRLLELSTGE